VFLDRTYWTETKPVYPLLKNLAKGTSYADHLHLHDRVDDVIDDIVQHAHERNVSATS